LSETRNQFAGTLLLILTVAAIISAVLSFQHLHDYQVPDDGVTWVDKAAPNGQNAVTAAHLTVDGPGYNAGIHVGDELIKIQDYPVATSLDVPQALWQIRILSSTHYTLKRNGIEFRKGDIIIQAAPRDSAYYYQFAVGFFYLAIGFFVYYRRTSAAKSLHFFILCLASFIASCFHYSGKLNTFDEVMYWGNVVCSLLAPAIFLHFCLTFQGRPRFLARWWSWPLIYGPSCALVLLAVAAAEGTLQSSTSLMELRWLLDRIMLGYAVILYIAGAVVLSADLSRADEPIIRRQLKYLRNGAILGILPFALFYALPYVLGVLPSHLMNLTVLSMALIPLTWAYAITRYRLMDVDIIFQQGYVYTLATLAVIGAFYGLIFLTLNTRTISPPAFVVLIAIATFVFQPIRRWIQELLDRWVFYRDRYDARLTIVEFARELSSETNQNTMLAKVSDRLLRTLSIQRIGFFLCNEKEHAFEVHSLTQRNTKIQRNGLPAYDLTFLSQAGDKPYIFFESPRHLRDIVSESLPDSVRDTIADLDFTYYVACRSRGRVLAYLGISRTTEGDFLSSDDIELLVTLSNYVAIAIENSSLYTSLRHKADEYERLKEFSENIVESINVGVLAVGLDDRVESWNSQIEKLTGIRRVEAMGQRLCDLFSDDLCQKFTDVSGAPGIHNVYRAALRQRVLSLPESRTTHERGLELITAPAPARESIVNLAIAPLISKDREQIGRLIIFDDITDREELERRLVQADKLSSIGLLAAGVAHEVNTPLAVISTYAQMLSKQVAEDEPKAKLLDKIAKQTFRASEIVNSLLNFSRTSPTEFLETDLNKVIRETASLVDHQFQKAGVAVDLGLADNLPSIRGNASKLQQVFLNLFLNARDAMSAGGALHVRSWSDGGLVHVEVRDSGQGIPSENLPRIYDPFFTTKGAKKGTGLGLSITYGIVQEHKGAIEVDSTLGKGTCFRLDFPVAVDLEAPAPLKQAIHA
jgi:two-component system NtrC family sensor kinase